MSDLGPFAIRRIEPGTSPAAPVETALTPDAPAASVLRRAAEVFVERVTGDVQRDSPEDAQVSQTIRAQSAAIDAEALTPLLGSLSGPPSLVITPRDPQAPSIDPSADAMRTSVFHPLADLGTAPAPGAHRDGEPRPVDRAAGKAAEKLQPLLDKFLAPAPKRT